MPLVTYNGILYPVRSTETILDGLIDGGANVKYSCRRGSCHTCMLQGDPSLVAQLSPNRLPGSLVAAGMFLPCVTRCDFPLAVRRPDWSTCFVEGVVAKKELIAEGLVLLTLDVPPQWQWFAGQSVEVRGASAAVTRHSIASVRPLDYFMELLIPLTPEDRVSGWVHDQLRVHDLVHFRGPHGDCHYRADLRRSPLLLIGSGATTGSALGLAREAQLYGHEAPVILVAETTDAEQPVAARARALAVTWPSFEFTACRMPSANAEAGVDAAALDVAFSRDVSGFSVFLFGPQALTERARELALSRGVSAGSIHTCS